MLPEKNWKSSRSATIHLPPKEAGWVRIRLDIAKDFRLTGAGFDSTQLRSELLFYNGKDREYGFPRRAAEFEITDICLEQNP